MPRVVETKTLLAARMGTPAPKLAMVPEAARVEAPAAKLAMAPEAERVNNNETPKARNY